MASDRDNNFFPDIWIDIQETHDYQNDVHWYILLCLYFCTLKYISKRSVILSFIFDEYKTLGGLITSFTYSQSVLIFHEGKYSERKIMFMHNSNCYSVILRNLDGKKIIWTSSEL